MPNNPEAHEKTGMTAANRLRCRSMNRTRHVPNFGRISSCASLVPRSQGTGLEAMWCLLFKASSCFCRLNLSETGVDRYFVNKHVSYPVRLVVRWMRILSSLSCANRWFITALSLPHTCI